MFTDKDEAGQEAQMEEWQELYQNLSGTANAKSKGQKIGDETFEIVSTV